MSDINTIRLPGWSRLSCGQAVKTRRAFGHLFDDGAADICLPTVQSTFRWKPMMPRGFLAALFASIAAACLLPGCQLPAQQTETPAAFGSLAQITAISPDTTQVLRPGERVKLKVDVSYVLTAESGTITLVVLAADNSGIAQDFAVITKGRGKSALEAEFTVPNTTAVRVFTPLVFKGQTSTSVADGRAFKVLPN